MENQAPNVFYALLKLSENIVYTDPQTGEEVTVKLQGVAGYIPCFDTLEQAEEAADNGKYQIVPVKTA
jgi:hypothetical protein